MDKTAPATAIGVDGIDDDRVAVLPVIDAGREHAFIERKSALLTSPQTTSGPTADRVASLTVQMPNGVTLKLQFAGSDASLLSAMIETLGRCDVPAGR